ncbi:hypothetical protein [Nodosilinea sp. E11]|uniref:hypothetical protein n=1 Tax=Nodosilinea sp. E11 TaxID=3037479 RepID=UPI0029345E6D|nr:hypothetical protein [Nodosilinea sp. E11]WOD37210.1 hypothetical protein RRF56_01760 [Nodosilinea sp. E11]
MKNCKATRQLLGLLVLIVCCWATLLPTPFALASPEDLDIPSEPVDTVVQEENWDTIDRQLVASLREAYDSTEDFTTRELDRWADSLAQKVDHPFLDWYFNFWNQKVTEYTAPVAWATHKLDSKLKILRAEDERELNANQILQKRMAEKFSQKFAEMVMTEQAQADLQNISQRALGNYASAIGVKLAMVQSRFQVPEEDWDKHLEDISLMLLQTGSSSYEINKLASDLSTKALAVAGIATTSKLASALVVKSASKMAAKGGAVLAAKWGASVVDPTLAIGLVAWDVWSYRDQVAKNRPHVQEILIKYITESKNAMLENAQGSGIMDAIASVQNEFLHSFQPRLG